VDIQFAYNNPTSGRKRKKHRKHVAKRKKGSKLKVARVHAPKTGGRPLAKRKRRSRKHARKIIRRSHSKKRHHKRRRNPEQFVYKKKSPTSGKMLTDRSGKFYTAKEVAQLKKRMSSIKKKYIKTKSKSAKRQLVKKIMSIAHKLKGSQKRESAAISELEARRADGWQGDVKHTSLRKKGKGKSKVAKRKRRKKKAHKAKASKAKRHHKRRKHRRKKHAAKIAAAPKRHKRRRRHKRAKVYSHRHSKRISHVPKGTVFYSRGKGKYRRHKLRFINPAIGDAMKEWLGHDVKELGSLAVGGAVYQLTNATVTKLLNMISPTIAPMTVKIPVVGPALIPLLAGALIQKYVPANMGGRFIGEGIIAAAVVGMGVSAGQMVIPASMLSGVFYTPGMNGYPQMGNVKYYPGMSGVINPQLGAVKYYPGMSGYPVMGRDPDFGKATDYGGEGGYTEGHKFSSSDFGQADTTTVSSSPAGDGSDTSGSGAAVGEDDYNEVVNNMGSMG
jgi:hypothetical protein